VASQSCGRAPAAPTVKVEGISRPSCEADSGGGDLGDLDVLDEVDAEAARWPRRRRAAAGAVSGSAVLRSRTVTLAGRPASRRAWAMAMASSTPPTPAPITATAPGRTPAR
jgi:hypothetical protein